MCSCVVDFINRVGKVIKCEACRAFYHFLATSMINNTFMFLVDN